MLKPNFTFHFIDEPQFRTTAPRQTLANELRAYRKHPERCSVKKIGLHRYSILINPWRDKPPTVIIEIEH